MKLRKRNVTEILFDQRKYGELNPQGQFIAETYTPWGPEVTAGMLAFLLYRLYESGKIDYPGWQLLCELTAISDPTGDTNEDVGDNFPKLVCFPPNASSDELEKAALEKTEAAARDNLIQLRDRSLTINSK